MEKKEIESQLFRYIDLLKSSGIKSVSKLSINSVDRRPTTKGMDSIDISDESKRPDINSSTALERIKFDVENCQKCQLAKGRSNLVFGVGNPNADIVFVGEAPGREEDLCGEPFVGKAGQLLTKIIEAIEFSREEVYICNVVKCRPPENRNPLPEEIEACNPILLKQLEIIKPKVICALGKFAAQTLLNTETAISALRGSFHDYQNIPLMPTYHPAYLLRNPNMKRAVWEDVKLIKKLVNSQ